MKLIHIQFAGHIIVSYLLVRSRNDVLEISVDFLRKIGSPEYGTSNSERIKFKIVIN